MDALVVGGQPAPLSVPLPLHREELTSSERSRRRLWRGVGGWVRISICCGGQARRALPSRSCWMLLGWPEHRRAHPHTALAARSPAGSVCVRAEAQGAAPGISQMYRVPGNFTVPLEEPRRPGKPCWTGGTMCETVLRGLLIRICWTSVCRPIPSLGSSRRVCPLLPGRGVHTRGCVGGTGMSRC